MKSFTRRFSSPGLLTRGAVFLWLVLSLGAPSRVFGQDAPKKQEQPEKELIAVLDLDVVGASESEGAAINERLREDLLKTGRFSMIDRSQIKQVLDEQAFQEAACTERECAVQAGRILGVRKIVVGKIVKIGSNVWQVSAMLIEVETAETLRAESVLHEGGLVGLLRTDIPKLAAKLADKAQPLEPVAATPAAEPNPVAPTPKPPRKKEPPGPLKTSPPKVRVYFAPAHYTVTISNDNKANEEQITGQGFGLGVDYFFEPRVSLTLMLFTGTLDEVKFSDKATAFEASTPVEGTLTQISAAMVYNWMLNYWNFYAGGGLFHVSANYKFTQAPYRDDVQWTAAGTGITAKLGFDYTFENRMLLGGGVDAGLATSESGNRTDEFRRQGGSTVTLTTSMVFARLGYNF